MNNNSNDLVFVTLNCIIYFYASEKHREFNKNPKENLTRIAVSLLHIRIITCKQINAYIFYRKNQSHA